MAHLSNVNLSNDQWNDTSADLIAVGVYEDKSLTPIAQDIDDSTDRVFSNAINIGDIKGKNGESHLFYVNDKRILLLGLGKKEKFDPNLHQAMLEIENESEEPGTIMQEMQPGYMFGERLLLSLIHI